MYANSHSSGVSMVFRDLPGVTEGNPLGLRGSRVFGAFDPKSNSPP